MFQLNNEQDIPQYLCLECLQKNFFDHIDEYKQVIDNHKHQINQQLVFNQQLEQQEEQIEINDNTRAYIEAKQRRQRQINQNKILQINSKEELEERINKLPVLPKNFESQNQEIYTVNRDTYLLICFQKYIENGSVSYIKETGEFQVQGPQSLCQQLEEYSSKQFNIYKAIKRIADTQFQYEKFMINSNVEILRSVDFSIRQIGENVDVILKGRGFPAFICGRQLQLRDQLILQMTKKSENNNEQNNQQLDIQMVVQQLTPQYVIAKVVKHGSQLAQDLEENQYDYLFTKIDSEQTQIMQFTDRASEFYAQIYRGYNKYDPIVNAESQIKIIQSEEAVKRIKSSLDVAQLMEKNQDPSKCFCQQNDNEEIVKQIFSEQQLKQRQVLIKQLLYGKGDNKNQLPRITEQMIKDTAQDLGFLPSQQQLYVINQALQQTVTCINGCPFSGKSSVACILGSLAQQQIQQNMDQNVQTVDYSQTKKQILIQAKQNRCADQLCYLLSRIYNPGEIIRVYSHTQQQILNQTQHKDNTTQQIEKYTLQELIIQQGIKKDNNFGQQLKLFMKQESLFKENGTIPKQTLVDFIKETQNMLLRKAKIIITSVLTAYDDRLDQLFFDTVIVDDASNINIGETFLCASKAINRLILIGDIEQQQQMTKQGIYQTGYFGSFMPRLRDRQNTQYLTMNHSYRQNSQIVQLLNIYLYHNQISPSNIYDGIIVKSLVNRAQHKLNQQLCLVNSVNELNFDQKSKTFYNYGEAQTVKKVVNQLIDMGVNEQEITIVTTQLQHELYIKDLLVEYQNIQFTSSNQLSGLQSPILIYSMCFSSQKHQQQGTENQDAQAQMNQSDDLFRKKNNRQLLRTLLSRARQQLIIVGDLSLTKKVSQLEQICNYMEKQGILKEQDSF